MQISVPAAGQTLQSLLPLVNAPAADPGASANAGLARNLANAPAVPAADSPAAGEGARITLSATAEAANDAPRAAQLPVVFAEIWREGMKIAVVDAQGGVTPLNGMVAPASGTVGSGGAALAAQRAIQVAQSVGGEIRVAGQTVDRQTIDMRAKLRMAYGA